MAVMSLSSLPLWREERLLFIRCPSASSSPNQLMMENHMPLSFHSCGQLPTQSRHGPAHSDLAAEGKVLQVKEMSGEQRGLEPIYGVQVVQHRGLVLKFNRQVGSQACRVS